MSKLQTIKNEVISGGSVDSAPPPETDRATGVIGLGAWLGLFVVLGLINLWMLVFVLGVVVSVFLHEVGHFYTARKSGMKVTQFFMGFGPRVWSFHRNDIEYGVRAIPLGAFVKIIGMSNLDEIPVADEPKTYRASSYPRRMWVITAGSVMHMIIAICLITGVYSVWGDYKEQGFVELVDVVRPGPESGPTPAWDAGLRPGDVILSIDGESVTTSDELRTAIQTRSVDQTVTVVGTRAGSPISFEVTTAKNPNFQKQRAYLGVNFDSRLDERVAMPVNEAFTLGTKNLFIGMGQATKAIVKVINPVNVWGHLAGTSDDLESRPTTFVGATRVADDVGNFEGWAGVLSLLAALNLSVGVFNMMPLLPLDGGHAAIATYERIRSRRGQRYYADVSKLMPVVAVTLAALAFMFLTGLYLDIARPLG
jgi:membrane-associated protease RseP (regulator of RpoE activity)